MRGHFPNLCDAAMAGRAVSRQWARWHCWASAGRGGGRGMAVNVCGVTGDGERVGGPLTAEGGR